MNQFRIGSLYPVDKDGAPNLLLSSGYSLGKDNNGYYVSENGTSDGKLDATLEITTDSVEIKNVSKYITDWLIPQLTNKEDENSIFNQYLKSITSAPAEGGGWGVYTNNQLLEALSYIGYKGYGYDQAANQAGKWAKKSSTSGRLYREVTNKDNYYPEELWSNNKGIDKVLSDFDTNALLKNIAVMNGTTDDTAPLWYPAMLYTYGLEGKGTSYPGPVLMMKPGETLELHFDNNINIAGLTGKQAQMASMVENNSYGLNGGSTAGGMDSTNFHMHGGHVTPTGFGDNVVSRYTTGQNWTTIIDIPKDHGKGSYWYHPHFHPAVNTQVYGGLSGFMQVGDPLSLIPAFKDVSRNLGVIKTMQVGIDQSSGDYKLAAVNGNILGTEGLAANRASMLTINGEYQPEVDMKSGGWQSFSFSNQDNNYYMNLAIRHQQNDGSWIVLPLYIYGEDGHTYPQIQPAKKGALGFYDGKSDGSSSYKQASNLISLPSGKRVDLLVNLPAGKSELISTYTFEGKNGKQFDINNLRWQPDKYAELSSENTDFSDPNSGPGAIATFNVSGDSPYLDSETLDHYIENVNQQIKVQKITPLTSSEDYLPDAIPSVNLFEEGWNPTRKRQFNYQILSLVGPEDQRDIPTQKAIAEREGTTNAVTKYQYIPTSEQAPWLGYVNPDLINDHVFPNGPLVIAQLGTMEEWSLRNWNWGGIDANNGGYFTSHPFHIHTNDYQVKESDNELPNKRSLEDVTQLNSSGYHYVDEDGVTHKKKPLVGKFVPIEEALNKSTSSSVKTTGYNDTIIRMLYQDFLGTFVHHCHLLEHEDAGMMQVVSVIENTDSSWIVPAETFRSHKKGLILREADSLEKVDLPLRKVLRKDVARAQVGDISNDFVQDIMLTYGGDRKSMGRIYIYDGASLRNDNQSVLLSRFKPYKNSTVAPWAFKSDFTGDGKRDLVTAGFVKSPDAHKRVMLSDLELTGWQAKDSSFDWENLYSYRPWEKVDNAKSLKLKTSSVGVGVGDFNLDNFDDYAFSYVDDGTLRIRILDGASVALLNQTGKFEGGYLPDTDILSDIEYTSSCFDDLKSLTITSGFNSYSQSAIENLIVTAESGSGDSNVLTFQLNSGHFIATGTEDSDDSVMSNDHRMSRDSMTSRGTTSVHDHHSHQMYSPSLDGVDHIGGSFKLSLTSRQSVDSPLAAATPTFAGALANGSLIIDNYLILSQGASDGKYHIGNSFSSDQINNSAQDLHINLKGINRVSSDDLTGITYSNSDLASPGLSFSYSSDDVDERVNLTQLAYQAYTNKMIKPSDLAKLSIANKDSQLTSQELISEILLNYKEDVESFFGGSLDILSSDVIANKVFNTLYDRSPDSKELSTWASAVANGLSKYDMPLAILRTTSGRDTYRVGLLSAASTWSQTQWGTNAVVDGHFSQGLLPNDPASSFNQLSSLIFGSGEVKNWKVANSIFDEYRDEVLTSLSGSPISDTGFF